MAANSIRFSPHAAVYRVNERITCTASGYPTPSAHWQRVTHDGSSAPWSAGPVLTITVDMVGDNNTWRCRATNVVGRDEQTISFLVVTDDTGDTGATRPWTTTEELTAGPVVGQSGLSRDAKIGIGVGVAAVLLLLILIVIICLCCCWRRKAKSEGESSTRPECVNIVGGPPTTSHKEEDDVQGTPPPEYCPRPAADTHQRARVKSRFSADPQAAGTEVPASPLDQSGYADLGLDAVGGTLPHGDTSVNQSLDAVGGATLPHGTEAGPGDTSVNRSLRRQPRRVNQSTDAAAPLGYVNPSFTDDTGVSDRPGRDKAPRPARKPRRSSNDLPSGLPTDTEPRPADSRPPGDTDPRPPGDRSFEIVGPDADDVVLPGKPGEGGLNAHPPTGVDNSAFDRLFPPTKPNNPALLRPSGAGVRSYENLAVAPPGECLPDRRLNRSYDPRSSYLPEYSGSLLAAGSRQGSNPTVHFNTETQAIDV